MAPNSRSGAHKSYSQSKPLRMVAGVFVSCIVLYQVYHLGASVCSVDTADAGSNRVHAAREIAKILKHHIPSHGEIDAHLSGGDASPTANAANAQGIPETKEVWGQLFLLYSSHCNAMNALPVLPP
jgi:hypothetical protein